LQLGISSRKRIFDCRDGCFLCHCTPTSSGLESGPVQRGLSFRQRSPTSFVTIDVGDYGAGVRRDDALVFSKLMLQLGLGALQPVALCFRQGFAGAVDIEGQHRKCRAIGACFAARAMFRRALERCRNSLGVLQRKDALLQVERVALPGTRCDQRFGDASRAGVFREAVLRGRACLRRVAMRISSACRSKTISRPTGSRAPAMRNPCGCRALTGTGNQSRRRPEHRFPGSLLLVQSDVCAEGRSFCR
jgi:hypothetical protein